MRSSSSTSRLARRADRLSDPITRTHRRWTSTGSTRTGCRIQKSPGERANVWLADNGERINLLSDTKLLSIRSSVAEKVW